jgi:hypothetical protein
MLGKFFKKKTDPDEYPDEPVFARQAAAEQHGPGWETTARFARIREEVYQKRFGKSVNEFHEFLPLVPTVKVMEFHRTVQETEVVTLVTSGMSDLPMAVPPEVNSPRRVELIFYCAESKQGYVDTMQWLAHFPHDHKSWIGAFHTIPNGNPPIPLWGSSILDTIFLLPPVVAKDAKLQEDLILDGDGVQFLWIVPLTTPESTLKQRKGGNAILQLFQRNRHPYIFDPKRNSYV